ncbi:MAG: DUF2950 family protein [Phycisphaerales bacterium JB039]
MHNLTRISTCVAAVALLLAGVGCQSQRSFATPEEALAALQSAAEREDSAEMRAIFGPRIDELRSPDPEQDEQDIAMFRHELLSSAETETSPDGVVTVLVGDVRWPFAVPIVRHGDRWRFDTDAGIEELRSRRIGRNELRTIAACLTVLEAQEIYRQVDRDDDGVLEYADRMMSSPGRKDGLYWPSPGGLDPSPIGPALARAATRTDEAGERLPFNGYFYRAILRQGAGAPGGAMEYTSGGNLTGGWAALAWPAEYDETGVMTFMVGHAGVIYEADLGPDTTAAAAEIEAFDPSSAIWRPVVRVTDAAESPSESASDGEGT